MTISSVGRIRTRTQRTKSLTQAFCFLAQQHQQAHTKVQPCASFIQEQTDSDHFSNVLMRRLRFRQDYAGWMSLNALRFPEFPCPNPTDTLSRIRRPYCVAQISFDSQGSKSGKRDALAVGLTIESSSCTVPGSSCC